MPSQRGYYEFMGYESAELKERYAPYADRFLGGGPVLDIGCGRGEFLQLLKERGVEALGVDADTEMVAAVRASGLQAEVGYAIEFLERHSTTFGGVFASHVIEHMTSEDVEALVTAAAKALRPGGRLLLVTPNPSNLQMQLRDFWVDLQHVRYYVPDSIRWLLHSAGLREVEDGTNDRYISGPQLPQYSASPVPSLPPVSGPVAGGSWRARLRGRVARLLDAQSTVDQLVHMEDRVARLEGALNQVADAVRRAGRETETISQVLRSYYPPAEFFVTGIK